MGEINDLEDEDFFPPKLIVCYKNGPQFTLFSSVWRVSGGCLEGAWKVS